MAQSLPSSCPRCGAETVSSQRFCPKCGLDMSGDRVAREGMQAVPRSVKPENRPASGELKNEQGPQPTAGNSAEEKARLTSEQWLEQAVRRSLEQRSGRGVTDEVPPEVSVGGQTPGGEEDDVQTHRTQRDQLKEQKADLWSTGMAPMSSSSPATPSPSLPAAPSPSPSSPATPSPSSPATPSSRTIPPVNCTTRSGSASVDRPSRPPLGRTSLARVSEIKSAPEKPGNVVSQSGISQAGISQSGISQAGISQSGIVEEQSPSPTEFSPSPVEGEIEFLSTQMLSQTAEPSSPSHLNTPRPAEQANPPASEPAYTPTPIPQDQPVEGSSGARPSSSGIDSVSPWQPPVTPARPSQPGMYTPIPDVRPAQPVSQSGMGMYTPVPDSQSTPSPAQSLMQPGQGQYHTPMPELQPVGVPQTPVLQRPVSASGLTGLESGAAPVAPVQQSKNRLLLPISMIVLALLLIGGGVAYFLLNPSPSQASQPQITTNTLGTSVNYAGVDLTVVSALRAQTFIDDPGATTDGMLRLHLQAHNPTTQSIVLPYEQIAYLTLPGGKTVKPLYVNASGGERLGPQQKGSATIDFAVAQNINVSQIVLVLGRADEAQLMIPLVAHADITQYAPKTVTINQQITFYGLNWTLTSATEQWSIDGTQASKGMRYLTIGLTVDSPLSELAIPGSPYNYAQLKVNNVAQTLVMANVPVSFEPGVTGKTGTLTFLVPQDATAFSLTLANMSDGFDPADPNVNTTVNFQL